MNASDKTYMFRPGVWMALALAGAALLFWMAAYKSFNVDEFEHLHSAWYLRQGDVPYRDFYQHHHPFLWHCLQPLFAVGGETLMTVWLGRAALALLGLAAAIAAGCMAVRCGGGRESFWLTLAILLCTSLFAKKQIEIRPDVPQAFCCLLSLHWLLAWRRARTMLPAFLSGLALGVAFLFLQKAVFFGAGVMAITGIWVLHGTVQKRACGIWLAGLTLPIAAGAAWLHANGAWRDYYWANWLLNANHQTRFYPWKSLWPYWLRDAPYWILYLASLRHAWRHGSADARVILGMSAWLYLAGFALPLPWSHFFILPTTLGGIGIALSLTAWLAQTATPRRAAGMAAFGLLISAALLIPETLLTRGTQARQLERAQFVLEHVPPGSPVHDGGSRFNLFRPDLHYFWYSVEPGRGLSIYRDILLPDPRYRPRLRPELADYDLIRKIRELKPIVIAESGFTMEGSGLEQDYVFLSQHENIGMRIFIRRDAADE